MFLSHNKCICPHYQGCWRASSHVYLFMGSFSIRWQMKSLAVNAYKKKKKKVKRPLIHSDMSAAVVFSIECSYLNLRCRPSTGSRIRTRLWESAQITWRRSRRRTADIRTIWRAMGGGFRGRGAIPLHRAVISSDLQDIRNNSYGPAVHRFAVWLLSENLRSCESHRRTHAHIKEERHKYVAEQRRG